ncbi:DUF6325 family protein [Egicoccus sp. AB-alg2]|uniref:DUF6325 family protein n=1 Tax=Egicoccus sp. AB-alg2 TaxID=3242693 RepID=UPI00359D8AD6
MAGGVYGPMDFLILEFPPGASGEGTAAALRDLVDRGTIRLYDLMLVHVSEDGVCGEIDPMAADGELAALAPFVGARSGLLAGDDLDEAARALAPGTVAMVVVYENTWAVPFVAAAREEGAQPVASARLTAQQIMDALDALETVG